MPHVPRVPEAAGVERVTRGSPYVRESDAPVAPGCSLGCHARKAPAIGSHAGQTRAWHEVGCLNAASGRLNDRFRVGTTRGAQAGDEPTATVLAHVDAERFPYVVWGPSAPFAFGEVVAVCPDKASADAVKAALEAAL